MQEQEKELSLKSVGESILGVIILVIIAIVLYNKVFIPQIAPKILWNDSVKFETEEEIRTHLKNKCVENFSFEQGESKITCDEVEAENELAELIVRGLAQSDEKIYEYVYTTPWKIYSGGSFVTTLYTTSRVICHPKFLKDYKYIKFITCEENTAIDRYVIKFESDKMEEEIDIRDSSIEKSYASDSGYSIVVNYSWKNTSAEALPLFGRYSIQAYQNGVELETDYAKLSDYDDFEEVESGKTVYTNCAYMLDNLSSEIEINITPFVYAVTDTEGPVLKHTIHLSQNSSYSENVSSESDFKFIPKAPGGDEVYEGVSYLFPSDTVYITRADLTGKSKDEVALIRNEIYARHGYVFQMEKFKTYFGEKAWYVPNENFSTDLFNEIEWANINFIKAYESEQGWN